MKTGARLRCKNTWYEQGERSSKFFFSLEKANACKKNIRTLCRKDGTLATPQDEILSEQKSFYQSLYSKDPRVNFDIKLPQDTIKILDSYKAALDKELSYEEIAAAVLAMKNNKTPGDDGLPIEIYKILWSKIGRIYYNAIISALDNGLLMMSMRSGVITLVPKKNKDILFLKNWRPLTLLNTDYKIVAKAFAECLKKVLPQIISQEQTGFMSGRNISTNIRKTIEIIEYTKKEQYSSCYHEYRF